MLSIVATPIGNLSDMAPRAVEALRKAEIIACEDTRRTWALLSHFGIPRPSVFLSYRQGNEEAVGERLLAALESGKEVALCCDGGTPGISDPGYRLVSAAAQRDLPMTLLPGACAAVAAVVLSGLPTSSFTFKGFPPRKPGALRRFFADDADRPHTLVVYEAPYRIRATLAAALDALGDRRCALCMELTKIHERVLRGWLSDVLAELGDKDPKGEGIIVVAGNHPDFTRGPAAEPPAQ